MLCFVVHDRVSISSSEVYKSCVTLTEPTNTGLNCGKPSSLCYKLYNFVPVSKQVCFSVGPLCCCVLLEQQVKALGCLETALEDRAVLDGVWVTAPAVKDVMIIPCHGLHMQCPTSASHIIQTDVICVHDRVYTRKQIQHSMRQYVVTLNKAQYGTCCYRPQSY